MKTYLRYSLLGLLVLGFLNARANSIAAANYGTDATLKSIVLSTATTLVYASGSADYNYTTSVSPGTTSLTIEATANDPSAKVYINGTLVPNGAQSGSLALNGIVTTTINMLVVASDNVTTHSYSIVVSETGSNNAFLSSLSISTGNTLVVSSTGPANYNYTTSITAGTASITVTATTADASATVYVNNTLVTSGTASGNITLNPAMNATTAIDVKVIAQDNTTIQTYQIIVKEGGSNNAFLNTLKLKTNANTNVAMVQAQGTSDFNYTASVKSNVSYVNVKPTAFDPTATITASILGGNIPSGSFSANSANMSFPVTIVLVVTAQDGVTQKTYSITVSNNGNGTAALSSLLFSENDVLVTSGGNIYTTDVDPSVTSVTFTPSLSSSSAGAAITVNGVAATSGSASAPVSLSSNPTVIPIVVTSQDGVTITNYSITVNRNGSNNANLSQIVLNPSTGLVLNTTGSSNINYTAYVSSTLDHINLTPLAADPAHATITIAVNGGAAVAIASGVSSADIPLVSPNATLVNMVVTAQDGTKQTYGITFNTTGSANANLSNITLSSGSQLVQTSGSSTINYITSVDQALTSLNITAIISDPGATMTYNGTVYSSGSPIPVTLAAIGSNTVVILTVVAADGHTTKTYSITISRAGSNNAGLSSIVLSSNTVPTASPVGSQFNYVTTVSPRTTSVTATVTLGDPNASFTVNGFSTISGTPSYPITLINGSTPIVIQVTAQDKVTIKTYTVTVTRNGAVYVWTGSSSGVWSDKANWYTNPATLKAPGAGDVASLGETSFTGSQPLINAATTSIGEIYIGPNLTTLTISSQPAASTLNVGTNLTVDAGANATILSSSATAGIVNIASQATVNVATGGKLTIGSTGKPITFTLQSTAASSASVGQITAGQIVGTVNVQRYITGGSTVYRGYRLLSSPVYQSAANGNNIYSLNYVQNSSLVTGLSGSGGFNLVSNPSLYLFREDVANINTSFTSGNYWGISSLNVSPTVTVNGVSVNVNYYLNMLSTVYNIPAGNGFMFFFRGDRTNPILKYLTSTAAESVTMTATGTLNAGPITVHDWYAPTVSTLSSTTGVGNGGNKGFHMVGNPYASNIDWDTYNDSSPGTGIYVSPIGGDLTNPSISKTIYVLDPVSKNYGAYMANSGGPGTNNATHIIVSGQAFFITSLDPSATLTFNESAKTTTQVTGPGLLMGTPVQEAVSQYLHLKLLKDTLQADEVYVNFKSGAKSQFVINEDAPQLQGYGIASLASMSSDKVALSINSLALPEQSETIALNVNATADGKYQLTMPEIKSVPELYDVWLMDTYKKDSVNMRQNPAYSFNISTSDAASYGSDRFSLIIRQNPALGLHLVNFTATKASIGAQVVWKTQNEENYTNFTIERSTDGGITFNVLGGFISSDLGTYSFLDKNPLMTTNRYRLKLEDVNNNISYSNIVTLSYGNSVDNIAGNISVYPNPASSTLNLSVTPFSSGTEALKTGILQNASTLKNTNTVSYDIKIISITGAVVKSSTSSSSVWQDNVSNLLPGTYIIQVVNNSDKSVVGKSTFVKL